MTTLAVRSLNPPIAVRSWVYLLALLLAATAWRIVLFNGPLGSDEVLYVARALDVATGTWSPANYNGALRYGFNIPAGFMVWLFGISEFSANLWPLICSVIELAAVWWFCRSRFGDGTALMATLLVALAPLHVAAATRLHADAVASAFLTLSFVLFFESEDRNSRKLAFLAGLAMGMVFWTKELLSLALFAFLPWPLVVRELRARWLWVVAGGLVMLFGHLLLMQVLNGDPLHLFRTVLGQIERSFIGGSVGEDGALYYFRYLFADVRHTALLAPLALLGLVLGLQRNKDPAERSGLRQVIFWTVSLISLLSFFPVSLSPLRLAMKQSNYLVLFISPLAILAAYGLSLAAPRLRQLLWAGTLALSLPLAMLEQQSYQVFVSNSRAAVDYARTHPADQLLGASNNAQLAYFEDMTRREPGLGLRIRQLPDDTDKALPMPAPGGRLIVVEDRETIGHANDDHRLERIPPCWQALGPLAPRGLGFSAELAHGLARLFSTIPAIGNRLATPFARLAAPQPARLWQLPIDDPWCRNTAPVPTE